MSKKTIQRLSIYRRILERLRLEGVDRIHSQDLAQKAAWSAAQVRRDLMATRYCGNPSHGYHVSDLIEAIGEFLDHPDVTPVVIIGFGNLGRAIAIRFHNRRPRLSIVAAFDRDEAALEGSHAIPVYDISRLSDIVKKEGVRTAIICVPAAEASGVAEALVAAGIVSILNFAPVALRVPPHVFVENVDLTGSLERVAFYSHTEFRLPRDKDGGTTLDNPDQG